MTGERKQRSDIERTLIDATKANRRTRPEAIRYVRLGRPPKPEEERGQVYSLRIPVDVIERLRVRAEAEGKQVTSMMREWIIERLEATGNASTRSQPAIAREGAPRYGPPKGRGSSKSTATPKATAKRREGKKNG